MICNSEHISYYATTFCHDKSNICRFLLESLNCRGDFLSKYVHTFSFPLPSQGNKGESPLNQFYFRHQPNFAHISKLTSVLLRQREVSHPLGAELETMRATMNMAPMAVAGLSSSSDGNNRSVAARRGGVMKVCFIIFSFDVI